ncbi:hypothetical protein ACFL6Y_11305 [Elusimicrobiota bacterium]
MVNKDKSPGLLKSFGVHSGHLLFNFTVFRLAKFFALILGARGLSTTSFGIFSYTYAFIDIFYHLFGAGVDLAGARSYKNKPDWREIWQTAAIARGFLSFLGVVAGFVMIDFPYSIVFAFWYFFFMQGRLWYAFANTKLLSRSIVYAGFLSESALLIAALIGMKMFGLIGFMAAFAIERGVEACFLMRVIAKDEPQVFQGFDFALLIKRAKHLISQSYMLWAMQAFSILASRIDSLLVKAYLGYSKLAFYSIAFRTVEAPLFIFAAIADGALAFLIRNPKNRKDFAGKSLRWALAIGIIGAVCFQGFSFLATYVFGDRYQGVEPILASYAWVLALRGTNMASTSYFVSIGKEKALLLIALCGLFISIAGNMIVLPRWGVAAVPLIAVLTEGTIFVLRQRSAFGTWIKEALFVILVFVAALLSAMVWST